MESERTVIEIADGGLEIERVIRETLRPEMGCAVMFLGVVRDVSDGERVRGLEFEVEEDIAVAELRRIREEAIERFGVTDVSIVHRQGALSVGEDIVLIVVGAAHRDEAFRGCRYVIEELKRRALIWKKEFRESGEVWVSGNSSGEGDSGE